MGDWKYLTRHIKKKKHCWTKKFAVIAGIIAVTGIIVCIVKYLSRKGYFFDKCCCNEDYEVDFDEEDDCEICRKQSEGKTDENGCPVTSDNDFA